MKRFIFSQLLPGWKPGLRYAGLLVFILVTTAWALVPSEAEGDVPKLINFQGVIQGQPGAKKHSGLFSITFKIYDAPTGGNMLWSETQSVTTSGGSFNVLLGATNPIPDSAFNGPNRYLGIAVASDPEMSPRFQLVSVGYAYRVNSVDGALGGDITSKISIGSGHINDGTDAFIAGANNRAHGAYAVVGGGGGNTPADSNSAIGDWSVVSGGQSNVARWDHATVGGGRWNYAIGQYSTVAGGNIDSALDPFSTVGGGSYNTASGGASVVAGGQQNRASYNLSTVSGGGFNHAIAEFATVGGGHGNFASNKLATISGGGWNKARGRFSVVCGGGAAYPPSPDSNLAFGDYSFVGGGKSNIAGDFGAAAVGGSTNKATGGYSFVGGGIFNLASGGQATVGGGQTDTASAPFASVLGGCGNSSTNSFASVGGGFNNQASGFYAAVAGGDRDTASGNWSAIPGGQFNKAAGSFSFAAGRLAKALHHGSFVWADTTAVDFASTGINQFLIRAKGGVGIGTNSPQGALDVSSTTGAFIVPRMTTAQRDALAPVNGMIIYNTSANQFNFYENGAWVTK